MALLFDPTFTSPFDQIFDQMLEDCHLAKRCNRGRGGGGKKVAMPAAAWPKLDLVEEDGRFLYRVDVPGVPKDQLSIEVAKDGRSLTLSFEEDKAEEQRDEASGKVLRRERACRSFARRVALPEGVEADRITASVADGVLSLALPKAPESQPKKITIA